MKAGGEAALAALERRIGYTFQKRDWLQTALTHGSALADPQLSAKVNYQRLEFLGDRVLGLVIAEMLLEAHPEADEGEIALRFNALVRNDTCVAVAKSLDLGVAIVLGGGEIQSGGRRKSAILGDVCEAVIGAIYLDGGLGAAARFIRDNWHARMEAWRGPMRDAKTALQEWAQGKGYAAPSYEIIAKTGPDHEPRFIVEALIDAVEAGRGEGRTRREAEQAAAAAVLVREEVWATP